MLTTTPVNAEERYKDVVGMSYLAFDQYQREVAWIEPLSDEQQEMLLARVARAQQFPENAHYALLAKDARARLVEQYQPVVLRMARRRARFSDGMEVLDLVNEGSIGLLEAIDRYGQYPRFHGKFGSLAVLCIRHALWEACSCDGLVVLPEYLRVLLSKMHKASARFEREHGNRPTSAQLASLLAVSEEKVLEVDLFASRCSVMSLEALFFEEEQAGEFHTFVNPFEARVNAETPRQVELQRLMQQVCKQVLSPSERGMLQRRYGVGDQEDVQAAQSPGVQAAATVSLSDRLVKRLRKVLEPVVCSHQGIEQLQARLVDCYSIQEAAACLGVGRSTISRYIAQGRLRAWHAVGSTGAMARCWRIPKEALEALRAACAQDGEEVAV